MENVPSKTTPEIEMESIKRLKQMVLNRLRFLRPELHSAAKLITRGGALEIGRVPKEDAGNVWDDYSKQVTIEMHNNPETFLRQPVIQKTVHPDDQLIAAKYLKEMAGDEFGRRFLISRLSDPAFGDPFGCRDLLRVSPMTVQHAYYIYNMNKYMSCKESEFIGKDGWNVGHIYDLGAGYGNFCRVTHQLGFEGGVHHRRLAQHVNTPKTLSYWCAWQAVVE
jgi:hypothetical protein